MSDDKTPAASGEITPADRAASERREAVREKAQRVHVRQSRARMARRAALTLSAVAAVAVVAVSVTWAVNSATGRPDLAPANTAGDGFAVGTLPTAVTGANSIEDATDQGAGAATDTSPSPQPSESSMPAVDIQVYVDYMSPGAKDWQLANAPQLSSWVNEGAATLTYHPVSLLTAKSNGTKYSLRAAAAAACVASNDPERFYSFNSELLVNQPALDTDGMTDTQLADLAQATGVVDPKLVRDCIEDGNFLTWAKDVTDRAVASIPDTDGLALTGTPTVLVNGQQYVGDLTDPAEFSQFVLTTSSGAFYESEETPTPTPTPTEKAEKSPSPSPSPSE